MPEDAAVTTVPIDTPVSGISQEQLNALPMKDYIETRNEQEDLKRHPESDEPAETDETSETGNARPPRKADSRSGLRN